MNPTQKFMCELLAVGVPEAGSVNVPPGVDWEAFEAATRTCRGYTGYRLDLLGIGSRVPDQVMDRIVEGARLEVLLHVQRESLLKSILRAFAADGVDACLLKGAALQRTVYPRPELRPMSDLDLWVPGGDLDDLAELLAPLGFKAPLRFAAAPVSPHVRVLGHPGSPTLVELHHHPEPLDRVWSSTGLGEIWDRTERIEVGNTVTRVMSPEDALVHLCLHASLHHEFDLGVRPFVDAAMLVESTDMDWDGIADRVEGTGELALWLEVALRVARETFGASVPDTFLGALGSGATGSEMAELARGLTLSHRLGSRHSFLGELAAIPTLRGRGHAIVARLTTHYRDSPPAQRVTRALLDVFGKGPRHLRRVLRGGHSLRDRESRRVQAAGWQTLLALRDREIDQGGA